MSSLIMTVPAVFVIGFGLLGFFLRSFYGKHKRRGYCLLVALFLLISVFWILTYTVQDYHVQDYLRELFWFSIMGFYFGIPAFVGGILLSRGFEHKKHYLKILGALLFAFGILSLIFILGKFRG